MVQDGLLRIGDGDIAIAHDQSGSAVTKAYNLGKDENGKLAYRAGMTPMLSPQQRSAGTDFYEQIPPEVEVPLGFQSWIGGAGFEEVGSTDLNALKTYNYSQGVDLSWGDRAYLSPLLTAGGTVETTNPKKFLFSEEHGLFAVNDRFVYEWTGSAWTERLDVGAGNTITDIFEYINRTDGYLLVGVTDESYYWSIDGVAWTQAEATPAVPSYRAAGGVGGVSAGTSLVLTAPAGLQDDDILVASISSEGQGDVTLPSGWNLIVNSTINSKSAIVAWKRADTESGSYTFTMPSSTTAVGAISAFQNATTSGSPFDSSSGHVDTTDASGTDHIAPAVTTLGANRLIIGVWHGLDTASITWGASIAGMTHRVGGRNGDTSMMMADGGQATAGTTGTFLATTNASVLTNQRLLILKPNEVTGATDVSRFGIRGSDSGDPVLWALNSVGDIRSSVAPIVPTWSAADATQVGQASTAITGMQQIDNTFYVFRENEIISYDGTTVSTVFASPTFRIPTGAGRPFLWVDGHIYFTYNSTLYQFKQLNNEITAIWPPAAGNGELNGTITAITGDDRSLFFAVKNVAGNTYIMKGDPRRPITVDTELVFPFHTMAYRGASDSNALLVAPADADALSSTNPQLVFGDGTSADYFILPRDGMRPEDDSNVTFDTTADRFVFGSFVDFGARTFPKYLNRGIVIGDDMDANDTIELQYQEPGGAATTIVTANSGEQAEGTLSTEIKFQSVRYKGILNNGASSTTPILQGFSLHATPDPPRKLMWVFSVQIDTAGINSAGMQQTSGDAKELHDHLMNSRNEYVTFTDLYGTDNTVKVLDVTGVSAGRDGIGTSETLTVTCVEI